MKTGILILNYNNASDTINCLGSVLKHNTSDIKFFVVDNASPQEECVPTIDRWMQEKFGAEYLKINDGAEVEKSYPLATFILSDRNDGYASGNNIGLKYIKSDSEIESILILNNDIIFIQDILPQLNYDLNNLVSAAIVSPLLLKKNGVDIDYNCARKDIDIISLCIKFLFLKKQIFSFQYRAKSKLLMLKENPHLLEKKSFEIELPSGSCMLFKKDFFCNIGGFDPNTFLYYEENILFRKVLSKGMKVYLIPSARCIHLGASTISNNNRRYEFDKKCDRSAFVYVNKFSGVNWMTKLFFNAAFALYSFNRFLIHKIKTANH